MTVDVGQVHTGAAHLVDPGIGYPLIVRPAAAARPIPGADGIDRVPKELDSIAPRPATGTRRFAIDARRPDRVDERAVCTAVAVEHGAPPCEIVLWLS